MNHQVKITIILYLGFSIVCLLPLTTVHATKLESGVMINATSEMDTQEICDDAIDKDNDGKVDADDQDCAVPTSPAGTCELEIESGVPINYGKLNTGQVSEEQKVTIKNVGTANAQIMVKAGDWIGGTSANPIKMIGPEITRVAVSPDMEFGNKFPLHISDATALSDLGPGQEVDSFWSLYADPKLRGSPHQEVSIDLICADVPTDLKNALTKGHIGFTIGDEFLQEAKTNGDNNENNTSAKNPNTPNPIPIPYPDTNNTTKAQITTD
jgi:hypothetical protein